MHHIVVGRMASIPKPASIELRKVANMFSANSGKDWFFVHIMKALLNFSRAIELQSPAKSVNARIMYII